jgi:hypothetical protein
LSLQKHLKALESAGLGDMVPSLNLYVFTNESRKEHGFAKHKQSGQYRHPTKQRYCHSKGSHEIELIKKTCQCPHSYHANSFSSYQPTHKSSLSSVDTITKYSNKELNVVCSTPLSEEEKERLKVESMLNVLTKSRPTQNIRDLYRFKCGYGPQVLCQKDAIFNDTAEQHYPSFAELMKSLEVQRANSGFIQDNTRPDEYVFGPGDIGVVNPGIDNGVPSGDKWWLLQINRAHPSSKNKSACNVFGFWLDQRQEEQGEEGGSGSHFRLSSQPVKIYYGSIVKENNLASVIPVEKLNSG